MWAIVFATSSVEPDATCSATCTRAATEHERDRELQESRHLERIGGSTATYTPIGIDSPTRQREAIAIGSSVTTDGPRVPASALHPLPACKAAQSHTGRALRRMLGLGPRRPQAGKWTVASTRKKKKTTFRSASTAVCWRRSLRSSRTSSTCNLDRSKPRSQSTGHHSEEPGPRRFEATANSVQQWNQLNLRHQSTCLGAGASKLAQQVSASTQTATIQTFCKRTQTETSQIILQSSDLEQPVKANSSICSELNSPTMRQHYCSNNKIKQTAYENLQECCSSETSIKPPATEKPQRDFTSTATENQCLGTQASTTERPNALQHRSIAIQTPQSLLDPGRKAAAEHHYFNRQQKRRRKQADPNENCVAASANDRSAAPTPTTTTKVIQSEKETGPSTSGTPINSQPTTEVPLPETPC